jgi:aspartate/methionine/tyrosine aminotransferase
VTPRTAGIVLASPNNPTGVVMSPTELASIAAIAIENDLWVVADEVYSELVFDGDHHSIAALPGMLERTVTVGSVSKSHAMPGWRVGWAIAPAELVDHFRRLLLGMLYGVSGFTQEAAAAAIEHHGHDVDAMREIYRRRRDLALEILQQAPDLPLLVPDAGMFVMADVRAHAERSIDFGCGLYNSTGVAVLDAGAFGPTGEGWVRISFTVGDDELAEGCRRIVRYISDRAASAERRTA